LRTPAFEILNGLKNTLVEFSERHLNAMHSRKFPSTLFLILLVTAGLCANGQGKLDSLRNALSTSDLPDTTKVNIYTSIAWEYKNRYPNTDSIIYYAQKGLDLSGLRNYPKGIALCNLYLGVAYDLNDEFAKALSSFEVAKEYFEGRPASKDLNEVYHNIGLNFYLQTHLDQAINYFELSKKAAAAIHNNSRLARANFYLGDIYNDKGNFTNALKGYLTALELYEQGGNTSAASNCLTNIATIYAQLRDYKKAREFIVRSRRTFEKSRNSNEVFQNYANIGIVYSTMGDLDSALILFKKGVALADSTDDSYWKTVFLTNMAELYTTAGNFPLALKTYEEILLRNEQAQEVNFRYAAHSGIGRILFKQGNRAEGIRHMEAALKLMQENRLNHLIMETAMVLSEMYEQQGDYKKALKYTRINNLYEDSIFNDKNEKKIQQLEFDYELEKKQRQIEKLNKNREIQKEKADKQAILNRSLTAGIVLFAIVIAIMLRSRIIVQKSKNEILRQKEEIELQAARLEELNNFKDKTFSVLSHDLRGPINSITAAVQMLNDKEITTEEYTELKPEINKQLNSLNLLLDNVLLWAKSYIKDERRTHPEMTNIHGLINKNVVLLQDTAERKKIALVNNTDSSLAAFCDEGQIEIVLRNLIMNAIKFTESGGSITMDAIKDGDMVSISVADTGVGMTSEQVAGIFTARNGRNTYGTEGEIGIGLGLLLCHEFVKSNHGTISVSSVPGKGSTFTIKLPAA
jgi:signal transduction histidine kinase